MLKPRTTIDAAAARVKLDALQQVVRRETSTDDHDPFDNVTIAAVARLGEAMKAEADALADVGARLGRAARQA